MVEELGACSELVVHGLAPRRRPFLTTCGAVNTAAEPGGTPNTDICGSPDIT